MLSKNFSLTTKISNFHKEYYINRRRRKGEKQLERTAMREEVFLWHPLVCCDVVFGYKTVIGTHG